MGAIKFKRGTTANKPTLQAGEIYVDTTKKTLTFSLDGTEEADTVAPEKYSIWAGTISAGEAGGDPTASLVTISGLTLSALKIGESTTGYYYIQVDGITDHTALTVICKSNRVSYAAARYIDVLKGLINGVEAIHLYPRKLTVSGTDVVADTGVNGFNADIIIIKEN